MRMYARLSDDKVFPISGMENFTLKSAPETKDPKPYTYGLENYVTFGGVVGEAKEDPSGPDPWGGSWDFKDLPYCPVYLLGENKKGGSYFRAHITSTIDVVEQYFSLLEVLYTMRENDAIDIIIDSPGGYIATGTMISTAIHDCLGLVRTVATGICASSGSLIWSSGHICTATETAVFMYHMSSHFAWGNSVMILKEAEELVNYVKNVFLRISVDKGHLLQEEADKICSAPDQEVWIPAKVMLERVQQKAA